MGHPTNSQIKSAIDELLAEIKKLREEVKEIKNEN